MASSSQKAHDTVNTDATDELDDLDDVLDEFSNDAKKRAEQQQPTASTSASATTSSEGVSNDDASKALFPEAVGEGNDVGDQDALNEDFQKELAAGMEALMKGLGGGHLPGLDEQGGRQQQSGGDGSPSNLNEEDLMKQFEQMMTDMGLGSTGDGAPAPSSSTDGAANQAAPSSQANQPPQPANFQEAIRNTMSRLKESDQSASSSAGGLGGEGDIEKLLAAFGGAGGEGGENEEGLAKMLESMMGELMSKDVLYDPLKELRDKYPEYLANPPVALSPEDRSRYEAQSQIVTEIIKTFDDPRYSSGNENEKQMLKDKVQELMNEMQDKGAPPQEIVGDLPPELENLPGMSDENCNIM